MIIGSVHSTLLALLKDLDGGSETQALGPDADNTDHEFTGTGVVKYHSVPYAKFLIPNGPSQKNSTNTTTTTTTTTSPLSAEELAKRKASRDLHTYMNDDGLVQWHTGEDIKMLIFNAADLHHRPLPSGFIYGVVSEDNLQLVLDRTNIPRSKRTLRLLRSAGIYDSRGDGDRDGDNSTPRLIAWAFLGLDGSLTSLHVEKEYRGQGFAKAVVGKLFREALSRPGGEQQKEEEEEDAAAAKEVSASADDGWAHSDTAEDNVQSQGVAKALGGRVGWRIYWVGVDLSKVQ